MNRHQQPPFAGGLKLPAGLVDEKRLYATVFIDLGGIQLGPVDTMRRVNDAIFSALAQIHSAAIQGQALMKVHIGESKCTTRMNPALTVGCTRYLHNQGADVVVAGDTTVAYTGPRGHRQNSGAHAESYRQLAIDHGWHSKGAAAVPFVVLDRSGTFAPAGYKRDPQRGTVTVDGIQRFKDFYPAEGFTAADFVINHAHLTLHGLAGVAGCIKSIAMGCSDLPGKLRMHQSLLPTFAGLNCKNCGVCARHCPESAIVPGQEKKDTPTVISDRCIGCGECVSVCKSKAVKLMANEIEDWRLGEETLPERMADYAMGLMHHRWDSTIHLMHLYTITELCDCVDCRQKPMVEDIGFLLGKNPFAIDRLAAQLLAQRLKPSAAEALGGKLTSAEKTANYVKQHYGIRTDGPVVRQSTL